jgi:hypothetical protein
MWNDHLGEVAVSDDHVAKATAVDLPTLAGQQEQHRIDEKLLVSIGLARRRFGQARTLPQLDILPVGDSDVSDLVTDCGNARNDLLSAHARERTARSEQALLASQTLCAGRARQHRGAQGECLWPYVVVCLRE